MKNIYKKCSKCTDGMERIEVTLPEGASEVAEVECRTCSGTATVPNGSLLSDDLVDTLGDILKKCNDIFEKVNE